MYEIEFADEALADLKWFKTYEQNEILDGIEANLYYEPTSETRNRGLLRPNQTSAWKLRLGNFRVYYDVDTSLNIVLIVAIGLKVGNLVLFRGSARNL
ncbi:MAG: type II toxin-antitoxin system RelE/ParE family toxin [Chloroflexi bacterium]|nr:type II toxin-antitoxin system RelE/ParE family toxin [Chloroflexota bacterium]